MGRGSADQPGLGLAVAPGGGPMQGLAYRIPSENRAEILDALWRREMRAGVYHPTWLPLETAEGSVTALVYVANSAHQNYAGDLAIEDQAWIMARARGERGFSYEYLGLLVKEYDRLGIDDTRHRTLYARILEIVDRATG